MSITYTCECGKRFRAKDECAGQRAMCPKCRREFRFPVLSEPAIPPLMPSKFSQVQIDEEDSPAVSFPPLPPQSASIGIPPPTAAGGTIPAPLIHKSAPASVPDQSQSPANYALIGVLPIMAMCFFCCICLVGLWSSIAPWNRSGSSRFMTENAMGATANAVENIERWFSSGIALGWFVAFLLCWLIISVNQLRRALYDHSHREKGR
jgi:hypothetical protein